MIGGTVAAVFGSLLPTIPLLFVLLIGLGVAITNWASQPRVATLAVFGIGLELLATLIGVALYSSLPILVTQTDLGAGQFSTISLGLNIVLRLCSAAAWGLVIAAVFIGRSGASVGHPGDRLGR